MKILHIHTDLKFLYLVQDFEDKEIENDILFIGNHSKEEDNIIKFSLGNSEADLNQAVVIANNYDVVVLFDLEASKSYIVNRLNPNVTTFWLFFGYELYGKLLYLMFDKQTRTFLTQKSKIQALRFRLGSLYTKYNMVRNVEFRNAIKRINYFLCLSKEEYDFLRKKFDIPEFMQRPYNINYYLDPNTKSGNTVLIGNNRSYFNNHFEILKILEKYPKLKKYAFLNYGDQGKYYQELLKKTNHIENFTVFKEFLNKNDFENVYRKTDAFVMNSYRQMAVGNIFVAIKHGVKIYLNKKNIYYYFLLNNGFLISEVSEFEKDIIDNKLFLTKAQALCNIKALQQLNSKFNKYEFLNTIKNKVDNKTTNTLSEPQ